MPEKAHLFGDALAWNNPIGNFSSCGTKPEKPGARSYRDFCAT